MTMTRGVVFSALLALCISGCKKDGAGDTAPADEAKAPPQPRAAVVQGGPTANPSGQRPANPHGGNPHAGQAPVNPHGGGGGGMAGPPPQIYEPTKAGERKNLGGMTFVVPDGWKEARPSSGMRKAQWTLSAGTSTAELVVFYFGPNGAGSVEANLERWVGQIKQDDGKASKDVAKTSKVKFGGLDATTVSVRGRYDAAMRPGAPERVNKAGQRLLGAIVESPKGPYYFKLVGDAKAVDANEKKFMSALNSAQKVE